MKSTAALVDTAGWSQAEALRELTEEISTFIGGAAFATQKQMSKFFGLSELTYASLCKQGKGPRTFRISERRLGTRPIDAALWLLTRENAPFPPPPTPAAPAAAATGGTDLPTQVISQPTAPAPFAGGIAQNETAPDGIRGRFKVS